MSLCGSNGGGFRQWPLGVSSVIAGSVEKSRFGQSGVLPLARNCAALLLFACVSYEKEESEL